MSARSIDNNSDEETQILVKNTFMMLVVAILSSCGGGSVQNISAGPAGGNNIGTIFDGPNGTILALPNMPAAGSGPFSLSETASYDALGTLNLDAATVGQPTSATANYNGFVKILERDTTSGDTLNVYIGRATLDADFGAQKLTGSTDNYFRNTGTPGNTIIANQVGGSLPITNGSVTSANGFIGSMYGQLDDRGRALDIKSNFSGKFYKSAGQDLAIGDVSGSFGDVPNLTLLSGQIVAAK